MESQLPALNIPRPTSEARASLKDSKCWAASPGVFRPARILVMRTFELQAEVKSWTAGLPWRSGKAATTVYHASCARPQNRPTPLTPALGYCCQH